ncbi:50S ribosomal protein L9 [Buchnera aphidicola]|uniref:Large ribosomal subunit protein bL9 n=1 Tax=Buchnera aphidicola subsp. Cinara cedri (strain Cc) TaxID=372461 RepID=RL9_BUCCC|nr:50S ribosomal protein L9 [Buchnera aphidicola]Q056Y0.1 RecName: Full=Large ribosomal subunit protein bL9; AltName: Full=50S ribosomal protein L9 [Buchnera aphidicola BCc]ABJ90819.1 50S ribosomal protein L9 [Buchnera aphidicola BCc]
MKVILLHALEKLGKKGQLITVKNGYARNYLIPLEKALLATSENIKIFEKKRLFEEQQEAKKIDYANSRIKAIKLIGAIIFFMKSSKKRKIFGSIGVKDISKQLISLGLLIKKNEIKLPNGLLHYLGSHTVLFTPYKNISTEFKVVILSK